ncbi:MAG TPA: hypothetical protein VFR75_05665 [Solirubrobacterales bacterium]|nr:hypothetical protein [Solirubrobacterales bacterium]
MAVMARETWTDERLDDLRGDMNRRFDEAKGETQGLQAGTEEEFRELRKEMNSRFDGMNARFDALQKTMVLSVVSVSASVISALIVSQF